MTTGTLVVEVEGNRAELKPNTSKPGNPLEFEHRDDHGNFVKWTTTIDRCDKPSLAGGVVTPCGTGSRLSRRVKGNVEWIALARKSQGKAPLAADEYWKLDNPSFSLLGYIGFNQVSGEVAFFDGSYSGITFNWNAPLVAPGGSGYGDDQGRAQSSLTYDGTSHGSLYPLSRQQSSPNHHPAHPDGAGGVSRSRSGRRLQPARPAAQLPGKSGIRIGLWGVTSRP